MFRPRIAIPTPTSNDLVYNRRSLPLYLDAIERSGGTAVELSLTLSRPDLQALVDACAGVLLPGSPADVGPARFGQTPDPATASSDSAREAVDALLLEDAARRHKPVLGICYGLQSINVWRGGTLIQDLSILPVNHPAGPSIAIAHTAAVARDSVLGELLDPVEAPVVGQFARLPVNSSHHQAIGIPGDGLRVTSRCPQDGVIEAVEAISGPVVLAVQWHPERSFETSASSRSLFRHLVSAAAQISR